MSAQLQANRREFLGNVGRAMLVASVGTSLSHELGISTALADEEAKRLTFGKLEPLAALMQDTQPQKLLPILVDKLRDGTDLKTLTAAAALANARTFGGQDYIGFHTFMALAPAYEMAQEMPKNRQALPVLKVLYRNANRIQAFGGKAKEVLHPVRPGKGERAGGPELQAAVRDLKWDDAEAMFAGMADEPGEAFNHLQFAVEDEVDVHRVVLSWRAWAILPLTGQEHAHSLLRQSLRYCLDVEQRRKARGYTGSPIRQLLPKLLDQYKLLGRKLGDRKADDAWIDKLARTIYAASREQAAEAAAAALADGFSAEAIGEAISLAANMLVLHDPGRLDYTTQEKPRGSVHGDSVGVHASDSANAWRNIARVGNQRTTVASLIVGAFHTAGQTGKQMKEPYPTAEHLDLVKVKDAGDLLREAQSAITGKEQARAAAAIHRYSQLNESPRPVFDLLLRYATSEDGALHAEKYYRTVTEEFAAMRPAFKWRQLVALARVTASEYGQPAPGYEEACRLLKV
jgi:hypothetical protein